MQNQTDEVLMIPAKIKAKLEEMAEKLASGYDYPDGLCFSAFNDGADALWTLLMEGAGDVPSNDKIIAMLREEFGGTNVSSIEACVWYRSQLAPVIQALKAENEVWNMVNELTPKYSFNLCQRITRDIDGTENTWAAAFHRKDSPDGYHDGRGYAQSPTTAIRLAYHNAKLKGGK